MLQELREGVAAIATSAVFRVGFQDDKNDPTCYQRLSVINRAATEALHRVCLCGALVQWLCSRHLQAMGP